MPPPVDPEAFYAELEKIGEIEVRNRFASGAVYGGDKVGLVEEWLRRKDQLRADEVIREQMSIARSAADSAREAADAARAANAHAKTANRIAIAAIVIAAISAVIAGLS